MKKSLKLITKLIFALSVLLLSSLIFAIGCDDGGDDYFSACEVGKCLEIRPGVSYAKVVDKTNVIINAKGLADNQYPRTDIGMSPNSSGSFGTINRIFDILRHGASSAIILVNRNHVTKDTVSLNAAKTDCKSASESANNALAQRAEGGTCRTYNPDTNRLYYYNYLGTVFDNTDTQKARGMVGCSGSLSTFDQAITDEAKFGGKPYINCYLQMVNNGPGLNRVEIDDNWVDGPGGTATEEVELYVTSLDVSQKTIPQLLSASENFSEAKYDFSFIKNNFSLAKYNKAIDNATFKKLFENNRGEDLKIKLKIVKSADY